VEHFHHGHSHALTHPSKPSVSLILEIKQRHDGLKPRLHGNSARTRVDATHESCPRLKMSAVRRSTPWLRRLWNELIIGCLILQPDGPSSCWQSPVEHVYHGGSSPTATTLNAATRYARTWHECFSSDALHGLIIDGST
jgi:hypothetical protein